MTPRINDLARLQRIPREVARWQKAQRQVLDNRPSSAMTSYRELVQGFPGIAQLWFEMGLAAAANLEFAAADEALRKAAELASNDANLLVLIAQQYHRLRQLDKAKTSLERAVEADPSSIQAQLSLASWCERERNLDQAWECVEACVKHNPDHPRVLCVRALLLHRQGRDSEAETVLRDLVKAGSGDASVAYTSRQLLGVVLDQSGQYAEAMRWLCEAKTQARRLADTARMERDYDEADRRRRALLAGLTPEMVRRWRQEALAPGSAGILPANHLRQEPAATPDQTRLALLGGHPRSGTTLLEQVLGAHPDVTAFDEPEAFVQEIWNVLAPMPPAPALRLETLDKMGSSHRAQLRQRYSKSLLRESRAGVPPAPEGGAAASPAPNGSGSPSHLLLDKNPSPTTALYLWLRIFPEIKVIIALRDPRDVIISCFFQDLVLTPTNANFLSLERTATHYVNLMDVWLRMRDLGGFDWIETRYEDLVVDVEKEGRRVTEFAGLSWHPDQARHHEAAKQKFLFAPTFSDVAKPVYTRAIGRWKNYAEALAPVQARLAPYCRAFGYAE